jgi:uncharacterized protein with PQ loop repeat
VQMTAAVGGASHSNTIMEYFIQFLNLSTIGLCLVFKIPQIQTIFKTKSIVGISIPSVLIELLSYTITLTYNIAQSYPASSFFEYYFSVAQDIVLVLLLLHYNGQLNFVAWSGMGLFLTIFYGLSIEIPNAHIIVWLIKLSGLLSASSKIFQLKEVLSTKESENVSLFAWEVSAYSCIARIITTLALTGDPSLLFNFALNLILNILIITSVIYYRKPKSTRTKTGAIISGDTLDRNRKRH